MPFEPKLQAAVDHLAAGRQPEAEQALRQILAENPANADAVQLLGVLAWRLARFGEGLALMDHSIALNPREAGYHFNKGILLRDWNKPAEAAVAFAQAVQLNPLFADAQEGLAHSLLTAGKQAEAVDAFYRLIQLRPDHALAYEALGGALYALGRIADSAAAFRELLRRHPGRFNAISSLAVILNAMGQFDESLEACRQAIAMRPEVSENYNSLGIVLTNQGKLQEAADALRQSIRLRPDYMFPYNNLGNALTELHQLDEAIEAYGHAQELQPGACDPHYNQGWAYMLKGDFEHGWPKMEWRFGSLNQPEKLDDYGKPRWDGGDLHGQSILLLTEQGLGDVIHFIRYAPKVAARGGRVLVKCRPELVRLCKGIDGVSDAFSDEPPPPFDVQIPLMSLGLVFNTTLESIPAEIPYIHPDPAASELWADFLDARGGVPRVAIAWAGSPENKQDAKRSMAFGQLAPLTEVAGVTFVSVQKGAAAAQAVQRPSGMNLIDVGADLHDFVDTAELLAGVDLVICVDTAVAHLAGAMGKPVWAMLPFKPDWRWMVKRQDSPWYPTMRLFRQEEPGAWAPVVDEAAAELRAFVEQRGR